MKHAVVTGGNAGIGLATVEKLLQREHRVTVISNTFEGFSLMDSSLVETRVFDLSRIEEIPALTRDLGDVDVLVNNAGVMFSLPFDDYPEAKRAAMMRINLEAPVALIRELSSALIARRGRVVNVASIAGQIGHPDIWYGIAKAGLINATKSFARILGRDGVTVNAVAPGPTRTSMLNTIPEARRESIRGATYSGRFAEAEEIASTILWLAADAPEYINGQCMDLNNGFFPR